MIFCFGLGWRILGVAVAVVVLGFAEVEKNFAAPANYSEPTAQPAVV